MPDSAFTKWPPEVVLALTKQMSTAEAVLFALSCKYLYTLIIEGVQVNTSGKEIWRSRNPMRPKLVQRLNRETCKEERLSFLALLEKDAAKWLLCTVHEKLHIRNEDETRLRLTKSSHSCRKECIIRQRGVHLTTGIEFHRVCLDLLIRRKLHGPIFGMEPGSMDFEHVSVHCGTTIAKVRHNGMFRVVDMQSGFPHLFVRVGKRVEFDLEENLDGQYSNAELWTCHHPGTQRLVVQAIRDLQSNEMLLVSTGETCDYCPTDVQVQVSRDTHADLFLCVDLIAWRDLGPRGSHNNDIWKAQKGDGASRAPRFDRSRYGERSIQEIWEQTAEVDDQSERLLSGVESDDASNPSS